VTKTITTTVCVPTNYTGLNPIELSASVSAATFDPNTANNTSSANVSLDVNYVFANGFEGCQ